MKGWARAAHSGGKQRAKLVLAAAFGLLLLLSGVGRGFAQPTGIRYPYDDSGENSVGLTGGQRIERDTIDKASRPRKPLESFYFDSTTRKLRIFSWRVSQQDNSITLVPMDTTVREFQIDYSFMRRDVGSASLGNLGAATVPLNYFTRPDYREFSFMEPWDDYLMTPAQIRFYNAKVPYVRISYEMSGQRAREEQLFHALVSQNISPSTSFNLDYRADGTRGMYEQQRALSRNFSASVAHTGKRYAFHGGYIYNVGDIRENGGVKDMRDVTDTVFDLPDNIPVWLDSRARARNQYWGHTYWWTHSYGVPLRRQRETDDLTLSAIPTIFFGQSFERTAFRKTYSDAVTANTDWGTDPRNNDAPWPAFYADNFADPSGTRDSIREALTDAKLFVQIQPYNRNGLLGLVTGGVGYEMRDYYNDRNPFLPAAQRPVGESPHLKSNSGYVYGGVQGAISRYVRWDAEGKLYIVGASAGGFSVGGRLALSAYIKERPLTLEGSIRFRQRGPTHWEQDYFSNHFVWENDFRDEKTTDIAARFTVPSMGLELGANYQLVQDKIYYGYDARPAQYDGMLNVMGFYARKDFRAGNFHFDHRVLVQLSSDQTVAPVPLMSAYLSYYFGFDVVKKGERQVLFMQIGLDGRYNTEYYAYAYNPATGHFHAQNETKLGAYPMLDAFVSAKWKRLLLLFKLQHWNCNMLGDNRYFSVLDYPQNRMMFKIGLSWSFYD